MIRFLDHDADLATCVPPGDRALATRVLACEELGYAPGPFSPDPAVLDPAALGLLLIDGLVRKSVAHEDRHLAELLVPGDVLLPWPPSVDSLQAAQRLVAEQSARFAVLDRRFLQAAVRWPALMVELLRRLNDQEHRIAVTGAICQLPRVEDRILSLLRHFGNRVGRVGPNGLRVPLPLTHRALGELVGARRPTVSIALSNLAADHHLRRLEDGTWLLPQPASG